MDKDLMGLQNRIDALFKGIDEAYDRAAKNAGISSSTQDILYSLYAYGDGLTQKQICDYSYNNKQTINSAIHKLEGQGYLHKEPGAGRTTLVSLTEEGHELARKTVAPVARAELRALETIPEGDRERLLAILEGYATTLISALGETASDDTEREG